VVKLNKSKHSVREKGASIHLILGEDIYMHQVVGFTVQALLGHF
jgi:hypothetical protein